MAVETDDPLDLMNAILEQVSDAASVVAQEILLASSEHDVVKLDKLLRNYAPGTSSAAANVEDSETGYSPLHAAITGTVAPDGSDVHKSHVNGVENPSEHGNEVAEGDFEKAVKTVQILLENGAVWNSLDSNDETPGCIAWRLGQKRLYDMVVDAGVRSEVLFQRLDGYEAIPEYEEDDADEDDGENLDVQASNADGLEQIVTADDKVDESRFRDVKAQNHDREHEAQEDAQNDEDKDPQNEKYLNSKLTFTSHRLVDDEANGVMMDWERDIMSRTVNQLLPTESGQSNEAEEFTILNIGHGMGIIDELFQLHPNRPRNVKHHIIEAHPDVISQMKSPNGFLDKHQEVILHEGRWQDVLPNLCAEDIQFDVIYFDTFAEPYDSFREFFTEWVIQILKQEGRWSFFHGLGADRRVCYDVYTKVVEMDLFEAGFDVDWENVPVKEADWNGIVRKYWTLDTYRLPICTFLG